MIQLNIIFIIIYDCSIIIRISIFHCHRQILSNFFEHDDISLLSLNSFFLFLLYIFCSSVHKHIISQHHRSIRSFFVTKPKTFFNLRFWFNSLCKTHKQLTTIFIDNRLLSYINRPLTNIVDFKSIIEAKGGRNVGLVSLPLIDSVGQIFPDESRHFLFNKSNPTFIKSSFFGSTITKL